MPKTYKISVGNTLCLAGAGLRTALTFGLWDSPVRFLKKTETFPPIPSSDLESFGLDNQKQKSDLKKAFALYWRERLALAAPAKGEIDLNDPALKEALKRYYEKNVKNEATVSAASSALETTLLQLKNISELSPKGRL